LLGISVPTDLDAKRLAYQLFERCQLTPGSPDFELGIALRSHAQQSILPTIVKLDAHENLRVAAIEVLCKSQNGGKRLNRSLPPAFQRAVAFMAPTRLSTAMIARNEGNCLDLVGLESSQIAVFYQVIRMSVMPFVRDVHADVVQDCGVFQPVALTVAKTMHAASLIEQRESESGHLARVLWPVVVALGELDHAAAPDVGIALDLRDLLAVSRDVIQKQSLP
jgi:hypothetical protein